MSTTALKIIAFILMLFDHIAEFIPNMPVWYHWIGRISAPLFFFCMSWGFYYTRDRKKYLLRMYLFGLFMGLISVIINNFHNANYNINITNNIFVTLFISCIIIYIIDEIKTNPYKGKKHLVLFIALQFVSTSLLIINDSFAYDVIPIEFLAAVLGNIFFNEGRIPFVILGIVLYYSKYSKKKLVINYCIFCTLYSFLYFTNTIARVLLRLEKILPDPVYFVIKTVAAILGIRTRPIYHIRFYSLTSYYWMVIFALPFMLLYNGKKGKGYKYFFYCFYPLHIYVLYLIGNLLQ